jgi:alpha-galactosidase
MTPALGFGLDHDQIEGQHPVAIHLLKQWGEVADYFYADFTPLTPYSLENNTWMAWQWNREDEGTGVIEAFRRESSPFTTAQLKLRGLDPAAHYTVKNLDSSQSTEFSGKALMEEGLSVTLRDQPASALLTYRRIAQK